MEPVCLCAIEWLPDPQQYIFIDKIMVELLPLNVGRKMMCVIFFSRLFNKYGVSENNKEIYNNYTQTFQNL